MCVLMAKLSYPLLFTHAPHPHAVQQEKDIYLTQAVGGAFSVRPFLV